uniref:Uncharacterized protein n=1 Tax=Picea glauca TaxID=3330 RepID=A0A117NI19_PICGL|nr:hypothetical protein ABT39_MTgene3782 [Picea glauca]QHR86064.1 hypothetical protein Q903MT_gene62 [Picea sitchensis]
MLLGMINCLLRLCVWSRPNELDDLLPPPAALAPSVTVSAAYSVGSIGAVGFTGSTAYSYTELTAASSTETSGGASTGTSTDAYTGGASTEPTE